MRVPLSWLRDYVDFDLPPERLAERLTLLGMEVQSIDRIGADWSSVVVGELIEVTPHPSADRLSLTKVRISDSDAPLSIVCGATNIAVGQRVPVALPGATLPGGRQIAVSRIQGTESQGMLASGAELGLTSDAEGILILSGDPDLETRLGEPLGEVVGDVVLDVDVKPNRGDALSLIGLAREVAAITGTRVRWPQIDVPESGDATDEHLWVAVADKRLCSRFVGRYVDNLRVGSSPLKVQLRLSAAGLRPVSNAVDASNYVMLEMGKPIHVFDAAAVSGGTIVVRSAHDAEQIETLDHVQRTLMPETLLIADAAGPLGIAGVMGGANSEVSATTTAAVIESAIFDPVSIRRTAFRYGLRSEASLRFEKGQEFRLARVGADRTAQFLAKWADARVAVGVIDTNPTEEAPRRVGFRPARVNRMLGLQIGAADMRAALSRVEIATEEGSSPDQLVAVVPTHRRDIDIEEDVVEEICRVRGYENLPPRLPSTVMPGYRRDPRRFEDTIRDLLAGRGLSEVVTNGLISAEDHARLGFAAHDPQTIRVGNPVTIDHAEMRRSMLPGLLSVVTRNERQRRADLAIFECGNVHEWRDDGPSETRVLAVLMAGNWRAQSWAEPARPAGLDDLKGVLEELASRLHLGRLAYLPREAHDSVEHPGRTASIATTTADGEATIGLVFEVDPRLLAAYEVRADRVALAILDLGQMSAAVIEETPQVRQIEHLPAVERDLAVIVGKRVAAGDVAKAIRSGAGIGLAHLELFDRYEGPPLKEDQISLAYRLRFQPHDAPMSEAEIDGALESVAKSLEREVGGRIRSGS
jgi:phenylalanyl-tRNA synthetase beta chain